MKVSVKVTNNAVPKTSGIPRMDNRTQSRAEIEALRELKKKQEQTRRNAFNYVAENCPVGTQLNCHSIASITGLSTAQVYGTFSGLDWYGQIFHRSSGRVNRKFVAIDEDGNIDDSQVLIKTERRTIYTRVGK